MRDQQIAVIRGGPSEEYEVSMRTGAGVLSALLDKEIAAKDIIINRQGEWLIDGFVRSPDRALADVDVVFIALHGAYGEDGGIQRLLDRFGIRYTGSSAYPSAVAMNKLLTKLQLKETDIKMAPHFRVTRNSSDTRRVAHSISELFGPEYVVKPVSSGSSVGVVMASGPAALAAAIVKALEAYEEVIVEKRLHGREATIGVLERFRDQPLYRLPAIEIIPPDEVDFFDYEHKYNGKTKEICPAQFTPEEKSQMEAAAETVHRALGLKQYSRSDFMVTPEGIYFLEVNTLPALTSGSLFPLALEAIGCTYEDFVIHLIDDVAFRT